MPRVALKARCGRVSADRVRIAERFDSVTVMAGDEILDEVGDGMFPEIRRDISDAQEALRIWIIAVRRNEPGQRAGVNFVPMAMLLEERLRIQVRQIVK